MDTQLQKRYKILLIGDSCKDIYHFGTIDRISPEAPVPILRTQKTEERPGMAFNVKKNLESFNIEVDFFTNKESIKKHRFIDIKTKSQLLRVDEGEQDLLPPFAPTVQNSDYDAVVISDYDKGFLTANVCEKITRQFKSLPVFVDSKKKDLSCFYESFIKINEQEYTNSKKICPTSRVIVTLGDKGALYKGKIFPTKKIEVHDVCGAGDVFLSSLAYAFLETRQIERAITYANKLATLSVTRFGTHVLTRNEINEICI